MEETEVAMAGEFIGDIAKGLGKGGDARTRSRSAFFASDADATSQAVLSLSVLKAGGERVDGRRLDEMAKSVEIEALDPVRTRNLFVWALLGKHREEADECLEALRKRNGYAIEGLALAKIAAGRGDARRFMKPYEKEVLARLDGSDDLDSEDRTYLQLLRGEELKESATPTASHSLMLKALAGMTGDDDFVALMTDLDEGDASKTALDCALIHALSSKRSGLGKALACRYGRMVEELACGDGGISAVGVKSPLDTWVERAFATRSDADVRRLKAVLARDAMALKASEHPVVAPLLLHRLDRGRLWALLVKMEDDLIFKKILDQEDDIVLREVGTWLSCALLLRNELPEPYVRNFAKGFKQVTDEEHAFKKRWWLTLEFAVAVAGHCLYLEDEEVVALFFRVVRESTPSHASNDDYSEYVMWLASALFGFERHEPPERFLLDHLGRMCERHESGKGLSDREVVELMMIREALENGRR